MSDTYTCARCRGVFEKGWTDEEAQAEATSLFGAVPREQQEIVCDDCFQEMTAAYPPAKFNQDVNDMQRILDAAGSETPQA